MRTQFEPSAAAWDSGYDPAVADGRGCAEYGCKLVFRHDHLDDLSAIVASEERGLDEFEDIAPSGIDSGGVEGSFDVYAHMQNQKFGNIDHGRRHN